ncbi:MAG: hypothetical protein K9G67_03840 [Bacteroidales bacterium]|nr:hypothetical protein [Bacteroidales bacterium]MCF8344908.1 hypothetical protein [Bacteroidales bacterium]MCF8349945.1 hypothetical protein [Bacteroidales bacterium]MCF8375462.1 hypothetical protein [Bacteroidales bacterium]MCF8402112.1 hypothetical protein [Bacteroidales bacterium]
MKTLQQISMALILGGLMLTSCNLEFTTANIADVKVCDELNGNLCNSDHAVLSTTANQISTSCKLKNAPPNTMVTFTWKYLENNPIIIDEVTVNSGDEGSNLDLNSTLSRPNNGWPRGKYAVEIRIGEKDKSPEIKNFEIR